jgi:hypothetical protein
MQTLKQAENPPSAQSICVIRNPIADLGSGSLLQVNLESTQLCVDSTPHYWPKVHSAPARSAAASLAVASRYSFLTCLRSAAGWLKNSPKHLSISYPPIAWRGVTRRGDGNMNVARDLLDDLAMIGATVESAGESIKPDPLGA